MKTLLLVLSIALFCLSCNNTTEEREVVSEEIANPVDSTSSTLSEEEVTIADTSLLGTYIGVLPCAECEGIETTIILRVDSTYKIITKYLDPNNPQLPFEDEGTFTVKSHSLKLKDKGDEIWNYNIQPGAIHQLNKDGSEVDAAESAHYILKKQ